MQSPAACGAPDAAQQPAARLAPQPIVGDGDGAGVDERRHDAPVRAGEHAGLFAEAGEDHVEHEAEDDDRREPGQVLDRGIHHNRGELVPADDPRQEHVGDDERQAEEDRVLQPRAHQPLPGPRPAMPAQLLLRGSLEQVLQLAEQHLHEHRLRAQPAAPDAADRHGAEREGDQHGQRDEHDQVKVLRPEEHAEQHEPPLQHVQHHQRLAADVDEGRGEEKGEEEPAHHRACAIEAARRLPGINPLPPPVAGHARKLVAERLVLFGERDYMGHDRFTGRRRRVRGRSASGRRATIRVAP